MTKFIILLIFLAGIALRLLYIRDANIIFDFDQIEDQFYTYKLAVDRDPLIIGRAIYGDARLHHGVFYYYYNFIPFVISGGNLFVSIYWNIFFNAAAALVIFFLSKSIFQKNLPALISVFIASFSFELIKFSSWLTIDTVSILITTLFYFGLWQFYKSKNWGLALSFVSLGLSLQADLSFIYLFPIFIIFWIIFRPKFPNFKLLFFSTLAFLATISTLILTEMKLNFSGLKTFLQFSKTFDEATKLSFVQRINLFFEDFFKNFSNNLFPQRKDLGIYLGILIILIAFFCIFSNKTPKREKYGICFLLLYLFSPAVILILGYHDKPWFLIAVPPAIALISGYAVYKLKYYFLILPIIFVIGISNFNQIFQKPQPAFELFDSIYDSTSYLKYQLEVVDYTYQATQGGSFAINAVTYPLYYNGLWAYLYNWYGQEKYGYVPSWLGGDQLHPYDLLLKSEGQEKYIFMIISETGRIPEVYKNLGRAKGKENGKIIEEKKFNGFTVYYEKSQTL